MSRYLSALNYIPTEQHPAAADEPIVYSSLMHQQEVAEARMIDLLTERGIWRQFTEEQEMDIDGIAADDGEEEASARCETFLRILVGRTEQIVIPDPQLFFLEYRFRMAYEMYHTVNDDIMTPEVLIINRDAIAEQLNLMRAREIDFWVAAEQAENVALHLRNYEDIAPNRYSYFQPEALYMEHDLRHYFATLYFFLLDKPRNDAVLLKNMRKLTKKWREIIGEPVNAAVAPMGLYIPSDIIQIISEF